METPDVEGTLIAVYGRSNIGKTETLRALARQFLADQINVTVNLDFDASVIDRGDFTIVFEMAGKTVAIISKGDPLTGLESRLRDLMIRFQPDLVFCATRSSGETVHAVENFEQDYSFRIVWTSTYQSGGAPNLRAQLHDIKATHLIDLAVELGAIPSLPPS